jgi:hypothetical protein
VPVFIRENTVTEFIPAGNLGRSPASSLPGIQPIENPCPRRTVEAGRSPHMFKSEPPLFHSCPLALIRGFSRHSTGYTSPKKVYFRCMVGALYPRAATTVFDLSPMNPTNSLTCDTYASIHASVLPANLAKNPARTNSAPPPSSPHQDRTAHLSPVLRPIPGRNAETSPASSLPDTRPTEMLRPNGAGLGSLTERSSWAPGSRPAWEATFAFIVGLFSQNRTGCTSPKKVYFRCMVGALYPCAANPAFDLSSMNPTNPLTCETYAGIHNFFLLTHLAKNPGCTNSAPPPSSPHQDRTAHLSPVLRPIPGGNAQSAASSLSGPRLTEMARPNGTAGSGSLTERSSWAPDSWQAWQATFAFIVGRFSPNRTGCTSPKKVYFRCMVGALYPCAANPAFDLSSMDPTNPLTCDTYASIHASVLPTGSAKNPGRTNSAPPPSSPHQDRTAHLSPVLRAIPGGNVESSPASSLPDTRPTEVPRPNGTAGFGSLTERSSWAPGSRPAWEAHSRSLSAFFPQTAPAAPAQKKCIFGVWLVHCIRVQQPPFLTCHP